MKEARWNRKSDQSSNHRQEVACPACYLPKIVTKKDGQMPESQHTCAACKTDYVLPQTLLLYLQHEVD